MGVTGGQFIMSFLKLKVRDYKWYLFGVAYLYIGVALMILSLFLPVRPLVPWNIAYLTGGFICLVSTFRYIKRYLVSSSYFLITWLLVAISGFVVVMEHWHWIPSNLFTQNATVYSLVIEMVLFSMALSDRINRMVDERTMIRNALAGHAPKQLLNKVWQDHTYWDDKSAPRQMTMMFIDIVAFSTSSNRLTGEQTYVALKHCLQEIGSTIREYGGVVDRSRGDGVFCYFGLNSEYHYKKSHAWRAFEAAIQIQRRSILDIVEDKAKVIFPLRIGINTDKVQVGNMGVDGDYDLAVMGHGVNIADALETACYPFRIMIGENTLNELGVGAFDGKAFYQMICRVRGTQLPLVGYEYNVFADNIHFINVARRKHLDFIGSVPLETRHAIEGLEQLLIRSTYGKYSIVNISPSGFGVVGGGYLGRTLIVEAFLDSIDGTLATKLKEQKLDSFQVEVRWGEVDRQGCRHGLKIVSLNKYQLLFLHTAIESYLDSLRLMDAATIRRIS